LINDPSFNGVTMPYAAPAADPPTKSILSAPIRYPRSLVSASVTWVLMAHESEQYDPAMMHEHGRPTLAYGIKK
jgi:hypothetical protein